MDATTYEQIKAEARQAAEKLMEPWIRQGFVVKKPPYPYCEADGRPIFFIVRTDKLEEKVIRPLSKIDGQWVLEMPEMPGRKRPLYNMLLLHDPKYSDAPVIFVEGEAKCRRLVRLDFIATTTSGGANSPHLTDFAPLKGRRVIIWRDNDGAGRRYAEAVSRLCKEAGAASVEFISIEPLGLLEGGDVVDYYEARKAEGRTDDEIAELIRNLARTDAIATIEWPAPEPLPETLLPVPPFDLKLLPDIFREWVGDIAERMQCPPDYLAAASIVMLAGVVGRRICIFPKAHDSWIEPPNLWGGIVGPPGQLKSPAMQAIFRPLERLEDAERKKNKQSKAEHKAQEIIIDAKRNALKKELTQIINGENKTKVVKEEEPEGDEL